MTDTGGIKRDKVPLRCGDSDCGLPYAYVQGGSLTIVSRHWRRKCVNSISLTEVRKLLEESVVDDDEISRLILD